ncbi:MAG: PAS domain S-box protein, partial [Bacteroidota bacterium]|nr:PAS domain S-box protein [Bacteroidota bacterium]
MNKQDKSKEGLNRALAILKQECQDIETTRKKKSVELESLIAGFQQTRDNYRSFFNAIDEFIFILDQNNNILIVNDFALIRLGYTEDELYGKPVTMILPADRHDEALTILENLHQGKTDFHPVPMITKSGIQIPIEARKSVGIWDGNPVLIVACKDVSELKLSEEKFSKLFYLNPAACCITDLVDNSLIEVNDAFCALLGYSRHEVVGQTAEALGICSPETANHIEESSHRNGKIKDLELTLTNKSGIPKQILFSSENIHIQDRKIRFVVMQDITELRHTTEDLMKAKIKAELSEEKYKQLFDNTLDHIFILEVTNDKRFKVLEVNPIQAKESGTLIPGCYIEDCLDQETAGLLIQNYRRCVEERTALIYEREFYGQIFLTHLLPVRDNNGNIYRIIGIAHNITKERALTEELVQKNDTLIHLNADLLAAKKRAEESDQLKTAFLQNISHE